MSNSREIAGGRAGHRERLRDRFLKDGLSGFHDYEVIELLLTLATPRKDCKDAAKQALHRFRDLPGVFEASPRELCEIPGIGARNLLGVKLIKAAADRYLEKRVIRKNPMNNSRDLFNYLYHSMRDKRQECFKVIFLDAKNHALAIETLFSGSLTSSTVYPREVILAALGHNAAALIFSHNHPSGDPEPSRDDIRITQQLLEACRVVGIAVHEHLIIGNNRYYSFADKGHIAAFNRELADRQGVADR